MRLSLVAESSAHPELRQMIEKAAETAAPHVEEITGLALPDTVTIRLTSRHGFVTDVMAEQRRALRRAIVELHLSVEESKGFQDLLTLREEDLWRRWMQVGASTIVELHGNREAPLILLLPDALHHQGAGEHEITLFVANELCHVAEHHAGDGLISRAHTMACPDRLGTVGYSHFVASGHGLWCAQNVTERLFGAPVGRDFTGGRESEEYKRYVREELLPEQERRARTAPDPLRAAWLPWLSETSAPPCEVYEVGRKWVTTVVGFDGGRDQLNRVWSDLSLLPTAAEVLDVVAWWNRVNDQGPTAA